MKQESVKTERCVGSGVLLTNLGNYLSFFQRMSVSHTVSDHAFIEKQVKSNIPTPKVETHTMMLCFEVNCKGVHTGKGHYS